MSALLPCLCCSCCTGLVLLHSCLNYNFQLGIPGRVTVHLPDRGLLLHRLRVVLRRAVPLARPRHVLLGRGGARHTWRDVRGVWFLVLCILCVLCMCSCVCACACTYAKFLRAHELDRACTCVTFEGIHACISRRQLFSLFPLNPCVCARFF